MPNILTITLNPALDMSTSVDAVRPEDKLRCSAPVLDPGGGGTNVARAIRRLGGDATAFVALAGFRGQQLAALLEAEGVPALPFLLPGETRLSLAVSDRAAKTQYRFVMPGPSWDDDTSDELINELNRAVRPGMHVVLSGSQPPGLPNDLPAQLTQLTQSKGAWLTLDTSGPALESLWDNTKAVPDVLRLDGAESEVLAGHPLASIDAVADFARALVASRKAATVVLALGPKGSVLATKGLTLHAVTPEVPVVSKVGAGDSFVGAFTMTRATGGDWSDALRLGVAAASAAVMSAATDLCRPADVYDLLPKVTITKL